MGREISETTKKQYEYFLSKYPKLDIKNPEQTYHELLHTKHVRKDQTEKNISLSCVKIIISAILWKLKTETNTNGAVDNTNIIQKYKKYINDMCKLTEKKELDHARNIENVPLWSDIIKKREELLEKKKYKYHLLLSLYTYIPPRRLKDYLLMKVINAKEDIDDKKYPELLDFNYYAINSNQFIFNNYKTKKVFAQQIIDVPDELKNIIMNYIKFAKIKPSVRGEKLFKCKTYHALHYMLVNMLGTSIDNIRHSYVNYIYKDYNIPDSEFIEHTAENMAHSVSVHLRYRSGKIQKHPKVV